MAAAKLGTWARADHIAFMLVFARGSVLAAALAAMTQLAACGGTSTEAKAPKPALPSADASKGGAPDGTVDRRLLEAILRQGPGWLLERVPVEDVTEQGKFKGWRVQELPVEWAHAEIEPGDIVTAVNGRSLEREDDLYIAWTTLASAKSIKISYIREGEPKVLEVGIWGDPDPRVVAQLGAPSAPAGAEPLASSAAPAPGASASSPGATAEPPAAKPKPVGSKTGKIPGIKETIVIRDRERPFAETDVPLE
jgi:hypothetical protein